MPHRAVSSPNEVPECLSPNIAGKQTAPFEWPCLLPAPDCLQADAQAPLHRFVGYLFISLVVFSRCLFLRYLPPFSMHTLDVCRESIPCCYFLCYMQSGIFTYAVWKNVSHDSYKSIFSTIRHAEIFYPQTESA